MIVPLSVVFEAVISFVLPVQGSHNSIPPVARKKHSVPEGTLYTAYKSLFPSLRCMMYGISFCGCCDRMRKSRVRFVSRMSSTSWFSLATNAFLLSGPNSLFSNERTSGSFNPFFSVASGSSPRLMTIPPFCLNCKAFFNEE